MCEGEKKEGNSGVSFPEADNVAINSWLPSIQTFYAAFVIHLPCHVVTSNQKRQAWGLFILRPDHSM
jgi:hypothetical protein